MRRWLKAIIDLKQQQPSPIVDEHPTTICWMKATKTLKIARFGHAMAQKGGLQL